VGRPFQVFYAPEDVERGRPQSHLADATADGQRKFEGWQVRADGSRFWGDAVITAIYGPGHQLRGFGEIVRDSTQTRQFQKELLRRALHDPLTGLPNRALLLDRMSKALARLERQRGTVAAFFVDLDRFKSVNDAYGHQAGDRVLVEVAQRLRAALRAQDTVARLSGDEFVVLCEVQLQGSLQAREIAERLAASLAQPIRLGDEQVVLGAGIGVAVTACAAHEPEELLRQADTAMYEAKRAHSCRPVHVRFFDYGPGNSAAD
jgi:diguanylate cyclase (GGDEF)-like protein